MKTVYEKNAMLTNTRSEKSVEAEIDNVRETPKGLPESLDAFLANQKMNYLILLKLVGKTIRYAQY